MTAENDNKRQSNFFNVCTNCKTSYSCCRETTPPVTSHRRNIIETYLKEHGISATNPFEQTEYVFPRLKSDGYCVFHDKDTKMCTVHPVKPETCVAGPITFDLNTRTGKIEYFIKMKEICPLAGTIYLDKKLMKSHLKSAKREILQLVTQLATEELKAILKKDEPETLKVEENP